jgi:hypothetical protein
VAWLLRLVRFAARGAWLLWSLRSPVRTLRSPEMNWLKPPIRRFPRKPWVIEALLTFARSLSLVERGCDLYPAH